MSKGELFLNEPLADYTSWRVGGPARQLYKPTDISDLTQFLQTLPNTELIVWLGLGSNLLVRDKGVKGTVIYTQGRLKELALIDDCTLRAEAGVTCAKLAKFCARHSLDRSAFSQEFQALSVAH
jgi:UDP-N-acetylmuramate dehydrogenase